MGKEVRDEGRHRQSPRLRMESTRQTRKRMTMQKIYESRHGKQSNLRTWILMLISPVSLEAIKRENMSLRLGHPDASHFVNIFQ